MFFSLGWHARKRAGIPEKDIQTSSITVSPRYADKPSQDGTQHITGYDATNTVSVTVGAVWPVHGSMLLLLPTMCTAAKATSSLE